MRASSLWRTKIDDGLDIFGNPKRGGGGEPYIKPTIKRDNNVSIDDENFWKKLNDNAGNNVSTIDLIEETLGKSINNISVNDRKSKNEIFRMELDKQIEMKKKQKMMEKQREIEYERREEQRILNDLNQIKSQNDINQSIVGNQGFKVNNVVMSSNNIGYNNDINNIDYGKDIQNISVVKDGSNAVNGNDFDPIKINEFVSNETNDFENNINIDNNNNNNDVNIRDDKFSLQMKLNAQESEIYRLKCQMIQQSQQQKKTLEQLLQLQTDFTKQIQLNHQNNRLNQNMSIYSSYNSSVHSFQPRNNPIQNEQQTHQYNATPMLSNRSTIHNNSRNNSNSHSNHSTNRDYNQYSNTHRSNDNNHYYNNYTNNRNGNNTTHNLNQNNMAKETVPIVTQPFIEAIESINKRKENVPPLNLQRITQSKQNENIISQTPSDNTSRSRNRMIIHHDNTKSNSDNNSKIMDQISSKHTSRNHTLISSIKSTPHKVINTEQKDESFNDTLLNTTSEFVNIDSDINSSNDSDSDSYTSDNNQNNSNPNTNVETVLPHSTEFERSSRPITSHPIISQYNDTNQDKDILLNQSHAIDISPENSPKSNVDIVEDDNFVVHISKDDNNNDNNETNNNDNSNDSNDESECESQEQVMNDIDEPVLYNNDNNDNKDDNEDNEDNESWKNLNENDIKSLDSLRSAFQNLKKDQHNLNKQLVSASYSKSKQETIYDTESFDNGYNNNSVNNDGQTSPKLEHSKQDNISETYYIDDELDYLNHTDEENNNMNNNIDNNIDNTNIDNNDDANNDADDDKSQYIPTKNNDNIHENNDINDNEYINDNSDDYSDDNSIDNTNDNKQDMDEPKPTHVRLPETNKSMNGFVSKVYDVYSSFADTIKSDDICVNNSNTIHNNDIKFTRYEHLLAKHGSLK